MGRPRKYPWTRWLRYGNLLLVRGRDYQCQPYALAIRFRQEAAKLDRRVSIKITGDILDITVKRLARSKK